MVVGCCHFRRIGHGVRLVHLCAQVKTNLQHVLHRFRLLQCFGFDKFVGAPVCHTGVQARQRSSPDDESCDNER